MITCLRIEECRLRYDLSNAVHLDVVVFKSSFLDWLCREQLLSSSYLVLVILQELVSEDLERHTSTLNMVHGIRHYFRAYLQY